jgi:AraC-like DNA-binding protein
VSYREHAVPPRWRGLAECVWTSTAPVVPEVVHVLPDGCMDVIWSGADLFVAGPDTAPHPFTRTAAATGLRFHPGVLPALLGVPADVVRDARVPLAELLPGPGRRAAALLADGTDPARLPEVLTRLDRPGGGPPESGIRAAAARLARGATAADVADALGWTTRTLHRRSVAAFGYGPSVLRRVLRFRRAQALLRAGVAPAEVAARTGYADQPHLSREVRVFAGVSPAGLAPPHTALG